MKITQATIRQIIKEELENVLSEQLSDDITYKQLNGILELAAAVKGNVAREGLKAIAKAADLSSDVIGVISGIMGLSESKQELNEIVLTIAAVVGAVKVAAGAKAVYDLGKAAFDKFKGEPTEKTDKMPLLDIFNLDPRYSEILDDRLEEEFINWWQNRIKTKPDGEIVETDELNVNKLLPMWLKLKYPEISISASNPDIPEPNWRYSTNNVKRAIGKLSKKKAVSDLV
jgi:hypothetical protein